MAKVRVPVIGTVGKAVNVDPNATVGATLGVDLFDADGNVLTVAALATLLGVDSAPTAVVVTSDGVSEINEQNGDYTFVASDAGRTVRKASGGSGETYTIPANGSVAYRQGTLIAIENDGGGTLTIDIDTDTLEGTDGATGSRTLGNNERALLQKVTATKWRYMATDI